MDKNNYGMEIKVGLLGIVCGGAGSIAVKYFFKGII
jgi:hypothetical protein